MLTVALLACYGGAVTASVDDIWATSPATQDILWAQQYAKPVNPANSMSLITFSTTDDSSINSGVSYTNTTGKPMLMTVRGSIGKDIPWAIYLYVNGVRGASFGRGDGAGGNWVSSGTVMIPPGASYRINKTPSEVIHSTIRWY